MRPVFAFLSIGGALISCAVMGCGAVSAPAPAPEVADVPERQPLDRPVEVRVGPRRSCARTAAGEVWCWGDGARPERVAEGADELRWAGMCEGRYPCPADAISFSGLDRYRCALREQGVVSCREADEQAWVPVSGVQGATRLSVGSGFGCALVSSRVLCWGHNDVGQLGRAGRDVGSPAAPVEGLDADILEIAAGVATACALRRDGRVLCWGSGADGGVANPEHVAGAIGPTLVEGVESVRHLTDRCALLAGGEVRCWGGWRLDRMLPCDHPARLASRVAAVTVVGVPPMRVIDSSGTHACGISTDGVIFCWGANEAMQLGDGTSSDHPAPRRVELRAPSGPRECATDAMVLSGELSEVGVDPSRPAVELCIEANERACFRYDLDEGRVTPIESPSAPPPARRAAPSWTVRRLGSLLSVCPVRGTECHEIVAPESFLVALEHDGRVADDGAIERPIAVVTEDGSTLGLAWTQDILGEQNEYQHLLQIYDLDLGRLVHEAMGSGAEEDIALIAIGDALLYALGDRVIITYSPRENGLSRTALRGPVDLTRVWPLEEGRWLYAPPQSGTLVALEADGTIFARHQLRRPRSVPESTPQVVPLRGGGYALLFPGASGGGGDVTLLDARDGSPVRTLSPPRCEGSLPPVPEC